MSRYWSEYPRYKQPDAGELKEKSAASKKKAKAKGQVLEPVVIQGRTIARTWRGGEKHGATTLSSMRIMRAGLAEENAMYETVL